MGKEHKQRGEGGGGRRCKVGREKVRKRIEEENSQKYVHIYIYILTYVYKEGELQRGRSSCKEGTYIHTYVCMYVPMYGQTRLYIFVTSAVV